MDKPDSFSTHADQLTTTIPDVLPPAPIEVAVEPFAIGAGNDKLERLIKRMQAHNRRDAEPANTRALYATNGRTTKIVTGLKCPRCNKRALRKARRVSLLDQIVRLAMLSPYHCRYCQYSEWRFMIAALDK